MAPQIDLGVPPLTELQRRRSEKWEGYEPGVISATIAEMDFPLADPVAEVLHAAVGRHDLGYASASITRLAEAFAAFAARRLGWQVDPDQVTLVPDVMVGLLELSRLLAGPDRAVAFAAPAYPPFLLEPPSAGFTVHPIPHLGTGGTDLTALAAAFTQGVKVLILANPHNPTGRVLPPTELAAIAELAAEHDAWVLADEIHAPLVLPGARHHPWLGVSEAARRRGFALTSASKAFNVAGLKCALLVTASDEARDVARTLPPQSDHAGLLGVLAAEAAFTDGDPWLDAVLRRLDDNRSHLGRLLADQLPDVRWTPPQAGYLAWLDFRALRVGDDPAATLLPTARVALSPGLDYGPEGAGFARLNFGTGPELLTKMITRIASSDPVRAADRTGQTAWATCDLPAGWRPG
jgi:cystathionine beta-lyase